MAFERSLPAAILLGSAWVGTYNWNKANPHSRLREKCHFSSHGATRERAVAPAVSGLALELGYVHMAIGVLLRTKHKLVRYLACGGCEEAHKILKMKS